MMRSLGVDIHSCLRGWSAVRSLMTFFITSLNSILCLQAETTVDMHHGEDSPNLELLPEDVQAYSACAH